MVLPLFACGAAPEVTTGIALSGELVQAGPHTLQDFALDGVCITADDACLKDNTCFAKPPSFSVTGTLDAKDGAVARVPACGAAVVSMTLYRRFEGELVATQAGFASAQLVTPSNEVNMRLGDVGELAVVNASTSPITCEGEEGSTTVRNVVIPASTTLKVPLPHGNDYDVRCTNAAGVVTKQKARVAFAERTYFNPQRRIAGLKITAPATATSGQPIAVTVEVVDAEGNAIEQVNGTIRMTVNDQFATQLADYELVAADKGKKTYQVTFGNLSQGQTGNFNIFAEMSTVVGQVSTAVVVTPP